MPDGFFFLDTMPDGLMILFCLSCIVIYYICLSI